MPQLGQRHVRGDEDDRAGLGARGELPLGARRLGDDRGRKGQKATNGKYARWFDYSNTVEGQTEGLAVFSHTDNEHPHRWLTRDYGTFGPRRIDEKSGKPFTVAKGESISQRVGILVHQGDAKDGKVAARYAAYVAGEL